MFLLLLVADPKNSLSRLILSSLRSKRREG